MDTQQKGEHSSYVFKLLCYHQSLPKPQTSSENIQLSFLDRDGVTQVEGEKKEKKKNDECHGFVKVIARCPISPSYQSGGHSNYP